MYSTNTLSVATLTHITYLPSPTVLHSECMNMTDNCPNDKIRPRAHLITQTKRRVFKSREIAPKCGCLSSAYSQFCYHHRPKLSNARRISPIMSQTVYYWTLKSRKYPRTFWHATPTGNSGIDITDFPVA